MNLRVKLRLTALGLGAGLMGVLIVIVILVLNRQSQELAVRLNAVEIESIGISDHFRDELRQANNALLHYRISEVPGDWQSFLKRSQVLDGWIDQRERELRTPGEKELLGQLETAFRGYRELAERAHAAVERQPERGASLTQFPELRTAVQTLMDLGQALGRAHYDAQKVLLAHANESRRELRLSVLALVALLFLFGIALAAFVYRDMIAPLRVKLVESQAFAERNEKLASLGLLAAGVAHEIRNPLTAIKTALFIQQKRFLPGSPEHADVKLVEREIVRLEQIVKDFLQFARPAQPDLTRTSAEQLLVETQRFFAPQLTRANIQLILEPSPAADVDVDPRQIKQVLINLVKTPPTASAATARSRCGRVRGAAGWPRAKRTLSFSKWPTPATGIPPEVEKRLFDPFFTTKENGTGLGLSIAARIVEKHGGVLQYQTQVNRGTTFGIVLPQSTS